MESRTNINKPVPRSNKLKDFGVLRIICLILYYGFAKYLPVSYTLLGRLLCAKRIRYVLCKHIFKKCGKNVNIERGCSFGSGLEIEVGDNSGLGVNCSLHSSVKIGSDVLMGPNCFFLAYNHAYKDKSRIIKSQGYGEKLVTTIGNDVWIGRDVIFTPGRTVKDGTVIAARTVMCKDFDEYSVIGGNPARLISTRE